MNFKYFLIWIVIFFETGLIRAEELSVFFTNTSVKKVEKAMKESFQGVDVTVFGRFRDFKESLKSNPAFVIADDIFSTLTPDYDRVASFKIGASSKINLILLSLDEGWKKKDISKGKIGALESGDRKEIQKFLEDKFSKTFDSVKTVSKPEDLFPLMVFKSVDFIAIEPHVYEELKSRFSAAVFEIAKSKEISLPSLYVKKGADAAKAIQAFKAMKTEDATTLGFSGVE